MGRVELLDATLLRAVQLSARASIAAGLSVAAAEMLRLPFPVYAMITAVIVTDRSAVETRRLSGPRLAGTVLGAALGALLHPLFPARAGSIAIGIAAAVLLSVLAGVPEAGKLAGYVCGIVLLDHGDGPWTYAAVRVAETALGIAIAMLVSFVPKLIPDRLLEAGEP